MRNTLRKCFPDSAGWNPEYRIPGAALVLSMVLTSMNLGGCLQGESGPDPVPGERWTRLDPLPAPFPILAVSWAGVQPDSGHFFALAGDTLFASPDGLAWTSRSVAGALGLVDLAWNGSQYLAVGERDVVSSPDGVHWARDSTGLVHGLLRGVSWGGGVWVAVGDDQTILTSPDGNAWTLRTYARSAVRAATWTGGRHVAVGKYGVGRLSPDGIAWDSVSLGREADFYAVEWNGVRLAAVGNSGAVATSDDGGMSWTAQSSGLTESLWGIAWADSLWVAVGDLGAIITSPDGAVWTRRESGTEVRLNGVAWNGKRLVAAGEQGVVLTSP